MDSISVNKCLIRYIFPWQKLSNNSGPPPPSRGLWWMSSAAAGGTKEQRRVGLFRGLAQQIAARAFIPSGRQHTTESMGRQESLLLLDGF